MLESYGIFLSALILAGGAPGDLFGRRIFLIGVGVFAAASIACGLALHRTFCAGNWLALLIPGSLVIISELFERICCSRNPQEPSEPRREKRALLLSRSARPGDRFSST